MNEVEDIPEYFHKALIDGRIRILENVRTLIYKTDPQLFDLLDYENDVVFNEPLLFAYFYSKGKGATLEQILWGYIENGKQPKCVNAKVDEHGFIYLPKVGWIKTNLANGEAVVSYAESTNSVSVTVDGNEIPVEFEPILLTTNKHFEVLKHQHSLLANHFFDSKNKIIKVEIDNITKAQKENLSKAFSLIQNFEPGYYKLLEQAIFKVMIFNDPEVKRNSFATLSVHGCAFFNSFQKEYDEIFFVEDIAHQCGHVIFNNIIYDRKDIFKISSETIIKEKGFLGMIVNLLEDRTLFVAFHAMFTYYGISRCLLACITKAELSALQKHEAMGRLAFCLRKYKNDINLLGKLDEHGKSVYFTDDGILLYQPMVTLYNKIQMELGSQLSKINLLNQPYNFSVKNFHKSNPLK
jgi:hypothetical protein